MSTEAITHLFDLAERGVLAVHGSERVRWLDGMLSGDIRALEATGPGSGCYALLLTPQGRVVADVHVLYLEDEIWLELETSASGPVRERLEKLIIADDVRLAAASPAQGRLAIEGPAAAAWLERAASESSEVANQVAKRLGELVPEHFESLSVAGAEIRVAAYAFTGDPGFQLFVPAAEVQVVADALVQAGATRGDATLFERRRIEAGTPWLGSELDESVLPAEARLERAVSTTKGCYTGQEVVARLRSRDRRSHLLVGLSFAGQGPEPGAKLSKLGGGEIGEVTSVVASPAFGAIGLGFVRSEHAEPGTRLEAGEVGATVAALPFAVEADA